jgi:hypothetical protein
MAYGLKVWNASGGVLFDSANYTIMLAAVVDLTTATPNGSMSFPELAGMTLYTQQVYTTSIGGITHHMHAVSITYPSGIPTVTWTVVPTLVATTLYIFAN